MDDMIQTNQRYRTGTRCRRSVVLGIVAVAYLGALLFDIGFDGGRDAALFFGIFGFVISLPVLLLLGKAAAALLGRFRTLGDRGRLAMTVAPALVLATLATYEGCRSRNPITKFERWVASPAPAGLRLLAAYTYKGINYWSWAFHFTIAPKDLPLLLARHSYQHETDPSGFNLGQVRDSGRGRPGYPVPPPNFKAVHRYLFHAPTGRIGYDESLYGDASQAEFFAYGYVE